MLDDILKTSSLLGSWFVFLGVLNLTTFYSTFDIDILSFLSFSEILTSFLDDLNLFLFFIIIMIIQSVTALAFLKTKIQGEILDIIQVLFHFVYKHRYKYILVFAPLVVVLSCLLWFEIIAFSYFAIYGLLFLVAQTLAYICLSKSSDNKVEIPGFGLVIIVLGTSLIGTYLFAQRDIQQVQSCPKTAIIELEHETVNCGRGTNWIYLGKTDDYIFVRNIERESSLSIPTSRLSKMEFR